MLLAHAFLPPAPYGSWQARGARRSRRRLAMPPSTLRGGLDPDGRWATRYSGVTKLVSPSWIDGTALPRMLDNPLARPGPLRDFVLALPASLLASPPGACSASSSRFAPLALVRRLRPWLWTCHARACTCP